MCCFAQAFGFMARHKHEQPNSSGQHEQHGAKQERGHMKPKEALSESIGSSKFHNIKGKIPQKSLSVRLIDNSKIASRD